MIKNGLYNTASAVLSLAISLLTVPLLIRLLGLDEYGLWTLVSAVVGMAGLAEAGLSVSTTVFLSRDLAKGDITSVGQTLTIVVLSMLVIATLAAASLCLGADRVVGLFLRLEERQRSEAISALQVGALVVWGQLLQQVLVGVQQAHGRYAALNLITGAKTVIVNLGIIGVACSGGRVLTMVEWQALVTIGTMLVLVWQGWRLLAPLSLRPALSLSKGREVARYSAMTWLVSLGSVLFGQADRLILGAMVGMETLGVYSAITSVASKINSLSAAPIQPLLPELSGLLAKANIDRAAVLHRARAALILNTVAAFGMGMALFTMAPQIVKLLIPGSDLDLVLPAFQLATLIYALYSPNASGYYILLSDAAGTCMTVQMMGALAALLLIGVAATKLGLIGAVAGNAGYLITWLLIVLGMKHLDIAPQLWSGWIAFPLIWFLGSVLVGAILPGSVALRILITVLEVAVLFSWFLVRQQIDVRSGLRSLVAPR